MNRSPHIARRGRLQRVGALILLLMFGIGVESAPAPTDTNRVLILYDSSGEFGWIGEVDSILLGNLLGHFPLPYQKARVEDYRAGDLADFRMVFYLGTTFNNALPPAFLQDVMSTTKTVCWMKYNLWQLGSAFESKFGFRFEFMDSSGFTNVQYKGETFSRHPADPELGRTTILNSTVARAPAMASRADANGVASLPYVAHASNFWYVADVPFGYMSEEDRYLVFADLLHDIVGIDHPENHRAIIRLEDVDPTYALEELRAITDYLHSQAVPFAVATIPVYVDSRGYYDDEPTRVEMSDAPEFVDTLKYMVARGGQLVLHGYTHQYRSELNPFTGASGDDYEFFRVIHDAHTNVVEFSAVPEDSVAWAQGRIDAGLREFTQARLRAVAWEPPHYAASALDYRVFATNFPLTIQRVLYFDDAGHIAGQFFPYIIQRDVYGQKVMPENLGNVEPRQWYNYPPRLPADIIRAARKNRVVRDGWASAYFHPYLDVSYLQQIIEGIKALGYTYAPLSETVAPTIVSDPQSASVAVGSTVVFRVAAVGSNPLRYQWRKNGSNIAGATNAILTLTNVQPLSAGAYTVVVSNAFGTATSLESMLTVGAPALRIEAANGARLSFEATPGVTYRLQYKNSLSSGSWTTFRTVNNASGAVTVHDPWAQFRSMRLYRLRAE